MMFLLDLAFANELLALGLGIAFLVWGYRSQGAGVGLAKTGGYVITILAILGLLCTSYYGTQYWFAGYFKSPMAHHMMQHQDR